MCNNNIMSGSITRISSINGKCSSPLAINYIVTRSEQDLLARLEDRQLKLVLHNARTTTIQHQYVRLRFLGEVKPA